MINTYLGYCRPRRHKSLASFMISSSNILENFKPALAAFISHLSLNMMRTVQLPRALVMTLFMLRCVRNCRRYYYYYITSLQLNEVSTTTLVNSGS